MSHTIMVNCPTCGIVVTLQAGQKECPNCKTLIGASVWVVLPSPLTGEEIKARKVKST
jgi:endogenous inhibitor of DNA gyrase (YacG/DUF329 family)